MDEAKAKLLNQAVVSVYFWARDPQAQHPPQGVSPMADALGVLVSQSDEEARGARRLAYAEAMRVYTQLEAPQKAQLAQLATTLGVQQPTDTDANHRTDGERLLDALSAMSGRDVTDYKVRLVPP